ncbi:hypothetical protein A4G18_00475 [Pasteurellaceae bacterium Pebbles2]|nr:hypothetical protein [Pasteurellaceae bacterium Pebbles2]
MTVSQKNLTVDEQLESLLADRKIILFRYDAYLRQQIYKKLTALQKKLLNRLASADIENINKKESVQLLKNIKELINESYQNVSEFSQSELNELFPLEVDAVHSIYNESVKFDLFNQVPAYKLQSIKNAGIISGSPLEDWWSKQANDLNFKFTNIIRQGILDGKPTSELISEVKELLVASRRWSETLVRTAVMKVHDQAQQALRDENLDILKGEQQISTLDLRTSEICRVRDGKAWDLDKKPIGEHDLPYQRPPLHPNCRSTLRLLTKSWRELGIDVDEIPESTRASMDGQIKEGLNYEDWLKNKSPEEQDKVLGKGKADLWRNGVITFRDMLDQSGRPLTLKELMELNGSDKSNNLFSKYLPKELSKVIEIGKSISNKYADVLDKAIADGKPHEGVMEIMRREGVELGGDVKVSGIKKSAVSELISSVQRYPNSWIEAHNLSGKVVVKEITKKGGIPSYNPALKIISTHKNWTLERRISTHIHEFGHRLQEIMPELDKYFVDFWKKRTAGKPELDLREYGYANVGKFKDGGFPEPYYGRDYGNVLNPKPMEMLTMTFESLLGGSKERFESLRTKDPELFHLGITLLTRYKL